MKSLIRYTIQLFLFWFLVFLVHRLFFVAYQWPIAHRLHDATDAWRALYKGWPLDGAMSVALLGLPMLSAWAYYWHRGPYWRKATACLVGLMIALYSAVAISDAGIYREWQAKINLQALSHFEHPAEVWQTLSYGLLALFFVLLFSSLWVFYTLYQRLIHRVFELPQEASPRVRLRGALIFLPISITLGVIVIRGGITNLPINQSIAYFSTDALANDIAVNPLYNLIQDIDAKSKLPDPSLYTFHSEAELPNLLASYFPTPDSNYEQVLRIQRPNLLFIFLESWSAHNVGVLGGLPDATPQFDDLSKEGLLFNKAYATAYVTDQGISAVLSATPSVSRFSVIQQPEWVPELPCLSEDLQPLGYNSGFMFGGDLVFGNLKGYLVNKQFTHILDRSNIPAQWPQGSLGLHDEVSLPWLLNDLNTMKQPFLYGFLTQSTHRPYDFHAKDQWQGPANNPEAEYTRSVHYSDACLGEFLKQAKQTSWYDSTLIILVADHSHNTWKSHETAEAQRHHIPMLWLGGALNKAWQGKTWNKIVSQLDIAHSLLNQMGLSAEHYPWSRNMFQQNAVSSSYYIFHGGGGYVNDSGYASYYQLNKQHVFSNASNEALKNELFNRFTAFQQVRYRELLLHKK
ncbi:MAG: LTA synthase family protein [Chitinophagaceae bacterium]|nr:LTA synthase family protein [Chitinophagaceae bacterium]